MRNRRRRIIQNYSENRGGFVPPNLVMGSSDPGDSRACGNLMPTE